MMLASTVLALATLSSTTTTTVDRYVVIVGHNGGGGERPALQFADDDAARLYTQTAAGAARTWLLTTFDTESARAFPDLVDVARPPSRAELARVLGEVFWTIRESKRADATSEFVFFFAGHGDVDDGGDGFLVMSDGVFRRADLHTQVLQASPADVNHVVIDACASFFMVARGDATSGAVPLTPDLLNAIRGATDDVDARTGVFVSTSNAAQVHESSALGGGVFSYLLRSALAGAADVNGDGRVEYAEAAAFVVHASGGFDDPRARLSVHARAPPQRPHAALVDNTGGAVSHFLVIDAGDEGRVRLLDSRGTPYAEVYRAAGTPVTLALTGNPFYVVQANGKEAVLVPRHAGAYAMSALSFTTAVEPRSLATELTVLTAPFERGYVDGYVVGKDLAAPKDGARFSVAFAEGAEAPLRFPWMATGGVVVGVAALALIASAGATVGNALAFAEYQQYVTQNRELDPGRANAVEGWRLASMGLLVGAVTLGAVGGSLFLVGAIDDGEGP